ncbi:MAG: DUF6291 domain-containing protein [Candidatus Faecousia sp.]|nr:DUF6291 domain-containing protein [Candidatus Faecousia sp.]
MGKLVYFKWMVEDAKVLKENLTTEQIGELFVAVMDYLQTGTVAEVSKDIRFPYADYRNKVDRACASYDETCAKRAESGKKGGTAKAKNAAKAGGKEQDQEKKFKPPTLKQFKNAVDEYADDVSDYDIESFYDHLSESKWQFEGMAIQSRKDWEQIISARFGNNSMPKTPNVFQKAFSYLISAYPRLHHRWDDVNSIIDSLIDGWDIDTSTWIVEGRAFKVAEWKEALDILTAGWLEDIPP